MHGIRQPRLPASAQKELHMRMQQALLVSSVTQSIIAMLFKRRRRINPIHALATHNPQWLAA